MFPKFYIFAENKEFIAQFCSGKIAHPFNYYLGTKLLLADKETSRYMVCFHGSGDNHTVANDLKWHHDIQENLVSFNFPDYDKDRREDDPKLETFGSIQELLPALYVLKNLIIDGDLKSISLYGFSAGGGVAVNVIAILSGTRFEKELQSIGIDKSTRSSMLSAIQNGMVILDCP